MYTYLLPQIQTDKNKIQVGAVGLRLQLEVKEGTTALDISSASAMNFIIERPDSTVITKPGVFYTNGSDGILYYITVSGDINQEGLYYAQAYLQITGYTGYTTPVSFTVYQNIPIDD